jgi:hypothetical protein
LWHSDSTYGRGGDVLNGTYRIDDGGANPNLLTSGVIAGKVTAFLFEDLGPNVYNNSQSDRESLQRRYRSLLGRLSAESFIPAEGEPSAELYSRINGKCACVMGIVGSTGEGRSYFTEISYYIIRPDSACVQ